LVLKKGKVGETYNIGGGNERTNLQVVNLICEILDKILPKKNKLSYKKQITFVNDRPGHDRRYAINARKIKTKLNWKPKENFNSGIIKTIQWYLSNKLWVKNIQNGEYMKWINKHYKK
jgi:dTDP-glucose 4,6-dehydratase